MALPSFANNVWRVEGEKKIDWMGGSPNSASAVEIAIGVYIAWQHMNPAADHAVAVYDSADRIAHYVGKGGP